MEIKGSIYKLRPFPYLHQPHQPCVGSSNLALVIPQRSIQYTEQSDSLTSSFESVDSKPAELSPIPRLPDWVR